MRPRRLQAVLVGGAFLFVGCTTSATGGESQGTPGPSIVVDQTQPPLTTESAPIAPTSSMPPEVQPTTTEVLISASSESKAPLYEAVATVLESTEHGPELCLGGILDSFPPQCGGVPLIGWDWATIDGEQTASGTTWIDWLFVTGRYDGTSMAATDVRAASPADYATAGPSVDFRAPCPEPEGGWLAAAANAPTDGGSSVFSEVSEYIDAQPDGAGMYVDQSPNPDVDSGINDTRKLVVVAQFTGDLERHEAALRAIWPGALCVTTAPLSSADLQAMATEIFADVGTGGVLTLPDGTELRLLSWGESGNQMTGAVEMEVVTLPAGAQEYFDATYGSGRVVISAQLRPVK